MKNLFVLILILGMLSVGAWRVSAQDTATAPNQQPSAEELEKQKAEREKNAYRLLDQVIDEGQTLRLTENRVRIQISAADLLWDRNQGRARSLFAMAAEGVAEMGRTPAPNNQRRGNFDGPGQQFGRSFALRQELVLAAARHDAPLAYQLLASTKPATPIQNNPDDQRGPRGQFNSEDNLEQTLLGRIAALDPKFAAQNAEQMLEKGQFPRSLGEVINQLQRQDADAATKLADKTVKKIQAANILTNNEAGGLAQVLLAPGPKVPAPATSTKPDPSTQTQPQGRPPVLEQSAYVDLLSTIIDAALKATPQAQNNQNNQRGPNNQRRGQGIGGTGTTQPNPPSDAQIEQNSARRLLAGLQTSLPMIDQYLPTKAPQVRQKLTEMGMAGANSPQNMVQTMNALQGNATADTLLQAAATAPQQMQARLYQQAAYKALDEGNADRARQIATDHLQANARDVVMQRIDFRELSKKAEGARIEEIRQTLSRLPTDNDRIEMLLQMVGDVEKSNPKLMLQLLDEAKQLVSHRATNYSHFEQQLKVAHAFATVDPARSFDVLDPGISQLNELLSAAATLNGFEINIFREGEMTLQGGNGLTSTVSRFGQELALLARNDFERSETLAGRFQFPESRIMTRLSIVQGLLGSQRQPNQPGFEFRNFGQTFTVRQ
jgi:hypothetical protein